MNRSEFSNRIEGAFGNVETNVTEDVRRGVHRYMGKAAQTVVATVVVASSNLRLLASFRRALEARHRKDPASSQLFEAWKQRMRRHRREGSHPLRPEAVRRVDPRSTVTVGQVTALLPNAPPG